MFNAPGLLQIPGSRLGYRIPYHKNTELTLFLYQAILDSILKRLFTEAWGEIRQSGKNASENLIRRTFNGVIFRSIIGSRYCSGILLAGLQAEVAAIIFSPASSSDVVNFARESDPIL